MSATEAAHARPATEPSGSISVPLTVAAAVVCGLGMLGTAYWLITFRWELFPSVGVVAVGAYLLFSRATGADHA